ncbi:DUF3592 domain-containing protein [Microbulbifer taiwanensis]|uniref:DUF3592 domain-containing protein n=1 Tax=Microbulbifer taiwanensis TaxID=986746 RepID=A0ABW1YGD4_9GAMM|nr:DUF3592 domain-containing protein [Microbulbifer taiwanensis]
METIQIVNCTGYVAALFSAIYLAIALSRRNWQKTSAKMDESKVDRDVSESHHAFIGEYFSSVRKVKSVSYRPILKYTYAVDGQTYTSTKLYSINVLPIQAQDLLPIISGSTRSVYYKPSNPARSYLLPSRLFTPCIFLLLGLFLAFTTPEQLSDIWSWGVQFLTTLLKP